MIQVKVDNYLRLSYDSKERFVSYWHQIHEITSLNPKRALEIGIGNGFVSSYLGKRGKNIIAMDIDIQLVPDIVGNILNIPFESCSFDVVACFEIMEHLPYDNFHSALSEMFRVSNSYALLTLPDFERSCRLFIQIPPLHGRKKIISLPRLMKPIHEFDGQHYWEIGKKNYSLKRIMNDIKKVGFKINKTYRIFEQPYHRFFILQK